STLAVGLIEGIAEATALITKVFSGSLSDYLGRRKFLTALGYGLAAFTKPLFALAPSVSWVVTARFVDRIGKGIRGAPRDALVGDIAPPRLRGACYACVSRLIPSAHLLDLSWRAFSWHSRWTAFAQCSGSPWSLDFCHWR